VGQSDGVEGTDLNKPAKDDDRERLSFLGVPDALGSCGSLIWGHVLNLAYVAVDERLLRRGVRIASAVMGGM
jgi:hypothetical protein